MLLGPQLTEMLIGQAEAAAARPAAAGLVQMVPFALMFLVLYFLLLRPNSRQRREHQAFLTALQRGDEVVTSAGMYGRVTDVDVRVVTLEVADKVRVRLLRDRVAGRWADQATAPPPAAAAAATAKAKGAS